MKNLSDCNHLNNFIANNTDDKNKADKANNIFNTNNRKPIENQQKTNREPTEDQ